MDPKYLHGSKEELANRGKVGGAATQSHFTPTRPKAASGNLNARKPAKKSNGRAV